MTYLVGLPSTTILGLLAHRHALPLRARSVTSADVGGDKMLAVGKKRGTPECLHDEIVTVISTGLERVICEGCGHLSFRYLVELTGNIDRSRFGREVDRLAAVS